MVVPDPGRTIDAKDVDRAKEILIRRQDTHLDSLAERLREPRVRAVIEPMLAGESLGDIPEDDRRFLLDLGLVAVSASGAIEVANPIYREVIPRVLSQAPDFAMPAIRPTWMTETGRFDARKLLFAFLRFWRQHGEALLGAAPYAEVAPQLVLMAFLHRVVNVGGTIEREYAIGSGRMDLCVRHAGTTLALELKVWRDGRKDPRREGLAQLDEYLAGLGLDRGWLVLFDQRRKRPPVEQRTRATRTRTRGGRTVTIVRA